MSYKVMARAHRPEVFNDVVAQGHVVNTLQNAIRTDRIAHAYLFSGPRGTGKTTTARLLAKALNCKNGPTPDPCGECEYCKSIADGRSMDVLEIDGASNRGIDEIRQLREEVGYAASKGKRKVYIIDEVHMLTSEAFNALLKTLEEPPPHVIFIFATTEPLKVPETILSRCQRYNFRRIPTEEIVGQLREILEETQKDRVVEDEALFLIARKADGAMRDGLSILDQACSFCEAAITAEAVRNLLGIIPRDVYFDLTEAISKGQSARALNALATVLDEGGDVGEFTNGLMEHFRHLLVACVSKDLSGEDLPNSDQARYVDLGEAFSEGDVLQMLQVVSELELNLGRVAEPRFWLELTLMKLVKLASTEDLEALMERLDRLEDLLKEMPSGAPQRVTASLAPVKLAGVPPTVTEIPPSAPPASQRQSAPEEMHGPPPGHPAAQSSSREAPVIEAKQALAPEPVPPAPDPRVESNVDSAGGDALEGDDLSLQTVQANWGDLVQGVKSRKISVGTFLSEGRASSLEDRQLTVLFKQSSAFHANQVKRNREDVEAVALELFGVPLRVVCDFEDSPGSDVGATEDEKEETDERVQIALKIFDGQILGG
jgi:DNA polymerase-3 subunit gamma/tau